MGLRDDRLRRNATYLLRGEEEGHSVREYGTPFLYR